MPNSCSRGMNITSPNWQSLATTTQTEFLSCIGLPAQVHAFIALHINFQYPVEEAQPLSLCIYTGEVLECSIRFSYVTTC